MRVLKLGRSIRVLALSIVALSPHAANAAALSAPATVPAGWTTFVSSFRAEAEAQGIRSDVFDAAFATLSPDPAVAAMTRRQPEFVKPAGAYIAGQVTPGRVTAAKAQAATWHASLDTIARAQQVPAAILVAVWGLESNFGAATGAKDVIRSMATLAAMNVRPELYRAELMSALTLLQNGDVSRDALRGSWAGAMGQPQFMPSSFAHYAVDGDGDGRRDIWASVPDALASIASFLRAKGWQPDRPWGFAVRIPAGFDYRLSRGSTQDWAARGLTRVDAAPMPAVPAMTLFFPAGAAGPAFLVTENFEVLKTYNFSDAYVLSVALLADRLEGAAPLAAAWPTTPPMSRNDRIALQTELVALGYTVDNREGRISLALRDVIRLAQSRVGLRPDGNPTSGLLDALRAAKR